MPDQIEHCWKGGGACNCHLYLVLCCDLSTQTGLRPQNRNPFAAWDVIKYVIRKNHRLRRDQVTLNESRRFRKPESTVFPELPGVLDKD